MSVLDVISNPLEAIENQRVKSLVIGLGAGLMLLYIAMIIGIISLPSGDTSLYAKYASYMWAGHAPYSGFHLEYPPGVIPFIFVAWPIGRLLGSYTVGYFAICILAVSLFLAHRNYLGGRRAVITALLLLLPLSQFITGTLDVFSAVTLYVAVYSLQKRRYDLSALFLAFSTLIKLYPGVCLLGLLWAVPKPRRFRYLLVFGGILAIVLAPLAIATPHGLFYAFDYHAKRPLEFEASGSAIGFLLHFFGSPSYSVYTFGSNNIVFSSEHLVRTISTACLFLGLALGTVMAWRHYLRARPALLSLIFLLLYLLFFKVGSPQYMIPILFLTPLAASELSPTLYRRLLKRVLILAIVVLLLFATFFDTTLSLGANETWNLLTVLSLARIIAIVELLIFSCRCATLDKVKVTSGNKG